MTNTITWTVRGMPAVANWAQAAYGNSTFVAMAESGERAYSADGASWTLQGGTGSGTAWSSIAFGNGVFVAIAPTALWTTPDGISWTPRSLPSSNARGVAYGAGTFVIVGVGSNMWTSPDGITWTTHSNAMPLNTGWGAVTFANGLFFTVDGTTNGATSPDGITWTARTLPSGTAWSTVAGSNTGTFVLVGGFSGSATNVRATTTNNGASWATGADLPASGRWKVIYGNGLFVAFNSLVSNSAAAVSPDGFTWSTDTLPASAAYNAPAFGNGKYIAADYSGASNTAVSGVVPVPPTKTLAALGVG